MKLLLQFLLLFSVVLSQGKPGQLHSAQIAHLFGENALLENSITYRKLHRSPKGHFFQKSRAICAKASYPGFPQAKVWANEIQQERKVVLITGASRGIGLSTAEHLSSKGYCVYATARSALNLLPHKNIHFEVLDVTDSSTIQSTVDTIIKNEGHIDIVINNAGCALAGPVECLSMEEIKELMDVNFFGVIRVCQAVLPHMRKQQKGHIINISSEQGTYGLPYGSLYTASKAALESLSEALSIELLPWNIRVSIVEPGLVATNFSVKLGSRTVKQNPYQTICEKISRSLQEKRTPSEFCQSPEEVAQFLQKIIEDPQPRLRYQTSKAAEKIVSKCLKDISGTEYSKWMKTEIEDWLEKL